MLHVSESEPKGDVLIDVTPPLKHSLSKDMPAVALVWKDVTVMARGGKKILLNAVSGQIEAGFCAIMGPSGSGKTTLLNTLACRLDRDTSATGELRLNGLTYSNKELKCIGGYVMQDDILNTTLTVQETLDFTAELRLPSHMIKPERDVEVDRVILAMGLSHCRQTLIGNPLLKGISGGERKRVCIAMELLMRPQLLFLDEPTSGLDSVSALSICQTLREMGAAGTCTIVCTIHQPMAKIFSLFQQLLLLKKGSIVYQGPAAKAVDHFAKLGYECPQFENPADHLMHVITPAFGESVMDLAAMEAKFLAAYKAPAIDLHQGADRPLYMVREVIPWSHQFAVLFRRTVKEQMRKKNMLYVSIVQTICMAVLVGCTWLQIGITPASLAKRAPSLFFCTINQGMFGALMVINSFPAERTLSLRERAAGSYYVSAYFLAKTLAETIFQTIVPVLFSSVVYFLIGYQPLPGKFFIFLAFMCLCNAAAVSLATAVSAIFRTTDMAVTILPMVLEVSRLFGGFFVSPSAMPIYFKWLQALSYCDYTYVAISLNELGGLNLSPCTVGPDQTCTGEQNIATLGLSYLTIGECAGILISYIIICRIFAYLGLKYIKW